MSAPALNPDLHPIDASLIDAEDDDPTQGLFAPEPSRADGEGESIVRRVLQDRPGLLEEIARNGRTDLWRAALAGLALLAIGGLSLGVFNGLPQALSAMVKAPLIGCLSVAIAFPALYVFAVLSGSRVRLSQLFSIFGVGLALKGAIIAGVAPLLLFLSCVGSPYVFVLVAGCLAFGIAEAGFLRTLSQGARILSEETGDRLSAALVHGWSAVYLLVTVQLIWSLRPIIGHPDRAFAIVEAQSENMLFFLMKSLAG